MRTSWNSSKIPPPSPSLSSSEEEISDIVPPNALYAFLRKCLILPLWLLRLLLKQGGRLWRFFLNLAAKIRQRFNRILKKSRFYLNILIKIGKHFIQLSWCAAAIRLRSLWPFPRNPDCLIGTFVDLRGCDPVQGDALAKGIFSFGGSCIERADRDVFSIEAPPRSWAEECASLAWLRHFRLPSSAPAEQQRQQAEQARFFVHSWINHSSVVSSREPTGSPTLRARRFLSLMAHGSFLLEEAPPSFRKAFLKRVGQEFSALRILSTQLPENIALLLVRLSVFVGTLCLARRGHLFLETQKQLDAVLDAQILPDGGHRSRNPNVMVEILRLLAPLPTLLRQHALWPSPCLEKAVQRLHRCVEMLRLGEGGMAQFHGTGAVTPEILAHLRALLPAPIPPIVQMEARHSGYQRLVGGSGSKQVIILVDTGEPPPFFLSAEAHASCLSFEMSVGTQRLIVNCGVEKGAHMLPFPPRSTRAHSTLSIGMEDSCRFFGEGRWESSAFGTLITSGPKRIRLHRTEDEKSIFLTAAHDGYREKFGRLHQRRLRLSKSGDLLEGVDRCALIPGSWDEMTKGAEIPTHYALRFHLHPQIRLTSLRSKRDILLQFDPNEKWIFSSAKAPLHIEESFYLPLGYGGRKTNQIVLFNPLHSLRSCAWSLRRVTDLQDVYPVSHRYEKGIKKKKGRKYNGDAFKNW